MEEATGSRGLAIPEGKKDLMRAGPTTPLNDQKTCQRKTERAEELKTLLED